MSGIGESNEQQEEEKKNEYGYILWEKIKLNEPSWKSPWGMSRPTSNIRCGVMANILFGRNLFSVRTFLMKTNFFYSSDSKFDMHTSAIDLKFFDNDNQIAQTATSDNDSWVNYFVPIDYLTIDRYEISKSSKNVFTIQQVLEDYTSREIRLYVLLNLWSTINFNPTEMEQALAYQKILNEFFDNIKKYLRLTNNLNDSDEYQKYNDIDLNLLKDFLKIKQEIHLNFCNSIDTKSVMKQIHKLVLKTNNYMDTPDAIMNRQLLINTSNYITNLIEIFGLNYSSSSVDDIGFNQPTK